MVKGEIVDWENVFSDKVSFDASWTIDSQGRVQNVRLENIVPQQEVTQEQLAYLESIRFIAMPDNIERQSIRVTTRIELL
ncbi:hypothetical protein [Shewanella sp. NIFS-20-20]|uniref:hypothetical protein n=1 Tax=Shewanella sp. NIFS-20-20 TaxID=2853806 RepID=UPI001C457CC6|nr:hypothetical protein [Shewanella sp. NIFS-20-20]MBV7316772.1 hypothetical protein [Shewanella sp. NIFS-20-20]